MEPLRHALPLCRLISISLSFIISGLFLQVNNVGRAVGARLFSSPRQVPFAMFFHQRAAGRQDAVKDFILLTSRDFVGGIRPAQRKNRANHGRCLSWVQKIQIPLLKSISRQRAKRSSLERINRCRVSVTASRVSVRPAM